MGLRAHTPFLLVPLIALGLLAQNVQPQSDVARFDGVAFAIACPADADCPEGRSPRHY